MTRRARKGTIPRLLHRFLTVTVVLLICHQIAAHGEIRWRSGTVAMPRMDQAELASAIGGLSSGIRGRHVVARFDRPLGPAERAQLEKAGLNLLAYLDGMGIYYYVLKGQINLERQIDLYLDELLKSLKAEE